MLNPDEIGRALHASRIVDLPAVNAHGPLGLEQLAAVVGRLRRQDGPDRDRVQRPIALPLETWEKLDQLARTSGTSDAPPLTASAVAAALLEQLVMTK